MMIALGKRTYLKMQQHTISLPGQTFAAITANEHATGPPVVFVHGITASVEFWLPSMPAEIRDGRRWISLSLPGHHPAKIERSAIDSWDNVTEEVWVDWFEHALQQLIGSEAADLVGWSTGGFTALALAAHVPRRVRSVLSICGFAIGEWLGLIGRFQRMSLGAVTRHFVRWGLGTVGRHRWLFEAVIRSGIQDQDAFGRSPACQETTAAWFSAFGQHDPHVMAELFRKIAQFDLSESIGRIVCPVLIAGGDGDPYISEFHTRWIADQIPGAKLELWPGAGHMFFAERTQQYQDLLVRWLEQVALRAH
jgi:pimeloyl-ACP methyl ester carboxylesterase